MNAQSPVMPDTSESQDRFAGTGKILIVGGYGQVGRAIAERLAPQFPGRVVVGGRSAAKASDAANAIGYGARGQVVDIFAAHSMVADGGAALDGVALVLVCLDQTDTRFVETCLVRGIDYVDISADHAFLAQVARLEELARTNGATALLSVGIAPGLTNMLAARARKKMEQVDRIDILLEIGLGDHHGKAAVEWMFNNLDAPYEVQENGRSRPVRSFSERRDLRLPGARTARAAYRFNFSDQHVVARTLDLPSVSTWVRFEDRLSTWAFAKGSQLGLGRLLRRRRWRSFAVWLFMNVHMGSDICAVAVQATGRTRGGEASVILGVTGHKEALMTAIAAAESVRQILTGSPQPGVMHSEQVIELDPVIAALKAGIPGLSATL